MTATTENQEQFKNKTQKLYNFIFTFSKTKYPALKIQYC